MGERGGILRVMDAKQQAGVRAVEFIRSGMVVGLGTGSTARFFIAALGQAIRDSKLMNIRGVPTSRASEKLADLDGVPLTDFEHINAIDVTVDGADEIAPGLDLIKGLGGALLREKLVAQNSRRLIIIADASKQVPALGSKCPLPVEVTVFAHLASRRFLQSLGCVPALRFGADGKPFITDNGNYIYDCRFARIADPRKLSDALANRAGIVESGLFLGMADTAIIADGQDVRIMQR